MTTMKEGQVFIGVQNNNWTMDNVNHPYTQNHIGNDENKTGRGRVSTSRV